ncbi:MAG: FAD-binding oxidoreductase [Chloroflexota bacterium]|nr:FAD-binding oxidoreductase [Chloroflexota bacterium]
MTPSLSHDLAALFGGVAQVADVDLSRYAVDGVAPKAVVSPDSVEALGRVLALASREKLAVAARGGGTLARLGNLPSRLDIVLDTTRLNRVVDHQPEDMTATVQGGIAVLELRRQLAKHGQRLPLDAPLPEQGTIGGLLATGFAGPRRLLHGLPRDWLLGCTVVLADGTAAKSGGKVVKNVTGYDLNKLYVGSLGTIGVIVEATFKLIPLPQEERALLAPFPSWAAAQEAAAAVAKLPFVPCSLELMDRRALAPLRASPAEVTLLVGLEGRRVAVARMVSEVSKAIRGHGASQMDDLQGAQSAAFWQAVADLPWRAASAPFMSLRASLLPSALGQALEAMSSLPLSAFEPGVMVGPGYGGLRLLCYPRVGGTNLAEEARRLAASFHQRVQALGGYAVVESCPPEVKQGLDVWGDVPGGLEVMRRLKAELDPLGTLNPGRYVGGL